MSKILSSAHVHTQFCDGRSTAGEMARAAYEKGFLSLGFSSHAPQHFDPAYCVAPSSEAEYIRAVRALQKEYEGRMKIYLGMERDCFSCAFPSGYDYFIASVHYLPTASGFAAVDGALEDIKRYLEEECGGDGLTLCRQYFRLLSGSVRALRPPIIGHFDLIRKNNAVLSFFDEEDPAYQALALETLLSLRETGAILEVNTKAVSTGALKTPYPAPFLLRAWQAAGGEVMINSDCHCAAMIDAYYEQAEELLRSLGYETAVRLGQETLFERYAL